MAKRTTKKVVANITIEQFEDSLAAYAAADAREEKINASMDEQFTKIREKYADELAQLKETKEESFEVVQQYATEKDEVLFSKKKSYETVHGLIGFRTGTPKLKTLRGFTWASVLELLKVKLPDYVRTSEEPNKERLLADREQIAADLPKVGVMVDQEEKFFIELKKEQIPA